MAPCPRSTTSPAAFGCCATASPWPPARTTRSTSCASSSRGPSRRGRSRSCRPSSTRSSGSTTVKEQVRALVAFLQVQGRRLEHGLPEVATSQHLVFLGNPGTGKTTIARLLAQMYRSMGLLEKGPPRRGRPRRARRRVRRLDRDQDRPRDPPRARRRALHRRGVLARAARRAAGLRRRRRSRRSSSGWRTTATGSS